MAQAKALMIVEVESQLEVIMIIFLQLKTNNNKYSVIMLSKIWPLKHARIGF